MYFQQNQVGPTWIGLHIKIIQLITIKNVTQQNKITDKNTISVFICLTKFIICIHRSCIKG